MILEDSYVKYRKYSSCCNNSIRLWKIKGVLYKNFRFQIEKETYREERDSYKLDLKINGLYQIELFSFPNAPKRVTNPEARGLRHLAFQVANLEKEVEELNKNGISTEPIRVDEVTGKRFTFFRDPDDLPLELYEK